MIPLGPFEVSPRGSFTPRRGAAPALRFLWRGRPCEARLEPGRLRLSALAGRLPSTAEAGADRALAIEAVSRLPAELPSGLALRLTPDHRLCLESETGARDTAPSLLGELVRFVLSLDPYLDRLEGAGAGTVKT